MSCCSTHTHTLRVFCFFRAYFLFSPDLEFPSGLKSIYLAPKEHIRVFTGHPKYSHIFNSVGPTLIIAPPPSPPTSTAPAHWRTRRRSNEIARMGLPEITDHQLDLKLPTPLGTQVTACPPGALLWQNAKRCTRLCAACGCDIKKKSNSNFPTVQLSRKCGSSTPTAFYLNIEKHTSTSTELSIDSCV